MPIPGISAQDYDAHFTPDGFKKNPEGEVDKLDYSEFRTRIGALIHELEALEAAMRKKELQVVPGREYIEPNTFAEMREEYFNILKELERPHSERDIAHLKKGLERLGKIIAETRIKLGFDQDMVRGKEINDEVIDLVRMDNALTILTDTLRTYNAEIADDTVAGEIDYQTQAALLREKEQRSKRPRVK